MKKFLSLVVVVVCGAFAVYQVEAQVIPNSGMETWITTGSYANPQGWDSPNQESTAIPIVGAAVLTKSGGAHSGSWCAKMESKSVVVATIPGLMTLGQLTIDIANVSFSLTGGAPINTRPTSVKGFYKYTPGNGGDTAAIIVMFSKFNPATSSSDTIGVGYFFDDASVTSWTALDAPILWFGAENPDTMNIVATCTSSLSGPAGSIFYVDDLALDYSTGISDPLMAEQPNVYYNAAVSAVEVHLELEGAKAVNVNIYNLNGQRVQSVNFGTTALLNEAIGVKGMKTGMYFVEILSGTERITRKILIP